MSKHIYKVLQSPFDRAFIEVVEFLSDNWSLHKKFRFRKDLLEDMGYYHRNWPSLRSGQRNVPDEKKLHLRAYLIREYDVRPGFLDTHSGNMFSSEPGWLKSAKTLTKEEMETRLKLLEKENEMLKNQARILEELAEERKRQIENKGKK